MHGTRDHRDNQHNEKRAAPWAALCVGAGERSRTPDLGITNALLYQLSYSGVSGAVLGR